MAVVVAAELAIVEPQMWRICGGACGDCMAHDSECEDCGRLRSDIDVKTGHDPTPSPYSDSLLSNSSI
jgi:hypothetical protein